MPFRTIGFFVKGMREFTKSGYEKAAKHFEPNELEAIDLTGKRIIITGANSGLGLSCSLAFAKKGTEVHMVCRNPQRAEQARQQVVNESNNSNVHVHIVDMSEPKEVSAFCSAFSKQYPSLNVLMNNAGCMVNTRTLNSEGMEVNFATNSLGTYILTSALLPILQASDDPRVITVSSGGMLTEKLNATDPELKQVVYEESGKNAFDGTPVYAQNKRQQVIMTEMWAAKHPEIFFAAMHPGWADTPAVETSMPEFHRRLSGRLRSPDQGADTAIWLGMTKHLHKFGSGLFFLDRKPADQHLPLIRTKSTPAEKEAFMAKMKELAEPFIGV